MRRNAAFDLRAVRRARLLAGLTVAEVAARVGVSDGAVKSWEAGRRTPTAATLLRLADALGVTVDDLLDPTVRQRDLAGLRQSAGLDRGAAASALGCSETTLRRVERGVMLPPDPVAMARLYRVTAAELAQAARLVSGR